MNEEIQNFTENTPSIENTGEAETQNSKHNIHILNIIGQIEGHFVMPDNNKTTKYEHVIPALAAIEQDRSVEGLLVMLNTQGGDVEAGLAIAELINGMKTPTVSIVLGGGHSIGVPLAVASRKSFIVPSGTMTVHPVRMNGTVLGVTQSLRYFERMQDRITDFITKNSKISTDRLRELMLNTKQMTMDIGTVLDGEDAVKEGLIDCLGGLSDAIDALYEMIENSEKKYE
jgi:ATP-dependent protease ClpP protease subunit